MAQNFFFLCIAFVHHIYLMIVVLEATWPNCTHGRIFTMFLVTFSVLYLQNTRDNACEDFMSHV